jgi:hypothetical protein
MTEAENRIIGLLESIDRTLKRMAPTKELKAKANVSDYGLEANIARQGKVPFDLNQGMKDRSKKS